MAGKFCTYLDALDYSTELATEIESSADVYSADIDAVVDQYDFNEELKKELKEDLQRHCEHQIRQGVAEFISRLTYRMSQSLHGFCVLRALGYVARIEGDNGKQVTSLRQIAKHFKTSSQWIYKLTEDLKRCLGVSDDVQSLGIVRKNYSMKVDVPKGYMTIGMICEELKTNNKRLQKLISENDIVQTPHTRGSKLIRIEDVEILKNKLNKKRNKQNAKQ